MAIPAGPQHRPDGRAPGAEGPQRAPSPPLAPPDHQRLERGIRELAGMLLSETTVDDLLESLTKLAVSGIPGCDAASVTLVRERHVSTPVASADVAVDIDRAQYAARSGPCLDTLKTGAPIRVDSFAGDDRWPEVAARAGARGIASSLSIPLAVADEVLGALNLYSSQPEAFAGIEEQARLLGRQASVTLANACALQRAELLAHQLSQALENRDIIGQAKGVIMAGQNVSSDQAFDVLRRASQRANRKLSEVARDIVERRNAESEGSGHTGLAG